MLDWKSPPASHYRFDEKIVKSHHPHRKCHQKQQQQFYNNILSWKFFQMLPQNTSPSAQQQQHHHRRRHTNHPNSGEIMHGNWSGPPDQSDQSEFDDDDHDFISFTSADAEYFATANLNSMEDVAAAIEACRKNILETTENTSSRRAMVNRLIQLQIRQEDLKEKNQVCRTNSLKYAVEMVGFYSFFALLR